MKKTWKLLAWILGIILILFIVITIGLTVLVNPNNFKPLISREIYNVTGQQIIFHGKIHWSFFPTLGLKLNNAEVKNPEGFGPKPLATIKHLNVGIKLLPLLHRQIKTTDLKIDELTLNLIKNKQGKTNWQTNTTQQKTDPTQTTTITKKDKTVNKPADNKNKTTYKIDIPIVEITNTKLNFTNQQNGQTIQLNDIDAHASNISKNKPFPFKLSFYIDVNKPDIHGKIQTTSQLLIDQNHTITLKPFKLKTNLKGKGLPQGYLSSRWQGIAIITSNSAKISQLLVHLNQSTVIGHVNINDFNTLATNLNLTASPFAYDRLTGRATIQAKLTAASANNPPSLKTLNGRLKFTFKNGAYQGINIPYFLSVAHALRRRRPPPPPTSLNKTTFGSLTGTARIKNGTLFNNDLVITSPLIYVKGGGKINLVSQRINYSLNINSAKSNDATLQNIPLIIGGTLKNPKPRLDTTKILQSIIKQQSQKVIDQSLDLLKSRLLR